MKKEKAKSGFGAIIFAMVIIIIPSFNIIDLLPDFIAYFILLRAISKAVDTAPYFAEAAVMLKRLAAISFLKIPALAIVYAVRGKNFQDYDITTLMTLIFSVAEAIILILAITNIFSGLFYIGERTEVSSTVSKFKVGKKEVKPENLKLFACVYVAVRAALCFLPEMLRLTRTVDIGNTNYVQHTSVYYPYALVAAVTVSLIFGIILVRYFKCYLTAIGKDGINAALNEIEAALPEGTVQKKRNMRSLYRPLYILIVAVVLSPEVTFDNFHDINLLPHFLYGGALTLALCLMSREINRKRLSSSAIVSASAFSAVALVAYIISVNFLTKHTYRELITGNVAKSDYIPLIVFSALELVTLMCTMILAALMLKEYIFAHTGISPKSDKYSYHEKEYHTSLIRRGYALFGIGAILGILKFVDVIIKYNAQTIFTNEDNPMGDTITTSALPWFSGFVFIVSLIYIGYSIYYIINLKEEVATKYSDF